MTYLLIIFVIALALAPLSHFVPSKTQRKIAGMREYAAVHGLFVEFRRLPAAGGAAGIARGEAGGDIIYYGKRLPPTRHKTGVQSQAWLRDGQSWRSVGRRAPVPAALAQLPEPVLAASADEASCGIYWRESGGEELVEQIRQVLESWSGQLRS